MKTIDNYGFLSDEMLNVKKTVRERYKAWSNLTEEVNHFAVKTQHILEIDINADQELLVATLFSRTLANVQAAIILVENGMDVQARVLLRAAMDSLFSLAAISKSKDVAEEYILADERERKRMLSKAEKWSTSDLKSQFDGISTQKIRGKIEEKIEKTGAKLISSESMSIKAGLHDWYLTAYSVFSASVHSYVRDLEKHLVVDKSGKIEMLKNEPELGKLCTT